MIQHGAEKIINNKETMLVDEDIESIITRGEARTAELNAKYSGLDFDDLANFKTETNTQQWEGENYAANGQAKKKISMTWIEPAKRERKMNYSENMSFRDMLRGGPAVPKKKKGPKKINTYVLYLEIKMFYLLYTHRVRCSQVRLAILSTSLHRITRPCGSTFQGVYWTPGLATTSVFTQP